ncbi:MAG: hypothetical protein Q4D38_04985 [Planctomycetia bacterium]|nr:hypothetical protein [Planctomycetia bacterium]
MMQQDGLVRDTLGEHICKQYVEAKITNGTLCEPGNEVRRRSSGNRR